MREQANTPTVFQSQQVQYHCYSVSKLPTFGTSEGLDPQQPATYPNIISDYPNNTTSGLRVDWMLLEYAPNPEFVATESWRYRQAIDCVGVQGQTECDEFPYFKTKEGGTTGPGVTAPTRAHLRMISKAENGAGGSDYGNSLTDCGLAHGDHFLIIPLAPLAVRTGLPSVRSC